MKPKTETRVRRCPKCVNRCLLTDPMCVTGKELAKSGIYEEVPVEKRKLFSGLFASKKQKY